MPLFVTLAIALAFSALFVGWSLLERRKSSPRLWVGFIATGISLPIAYFLGAFSSSFSDNLCYSEVIHALLEQRQGSQLQALPLYGYETSCAEVLTAVRVK